MKTQLRRLRVWLAVIDQGGANQAAAQLHLTAASVTRAVRELAAVFGRPLLESGPRGFSPTRAGAILGERTRSALHHLETAGNAISRHTAGGEARACFVRRVTSRQIQALIAIADHGTERAAAAALSLSQPAITMALSDLEKLAGQQLFTRSRYRMVPTDLGGIVIQCAKLAMAEIDRALDDVLAEENGIISGSIVIGMLPLSGANLVPRAVDTFTRNHAKVRVSVVEGTYNSLNDGLRSGQIEAIVGGLMHREAEADIHSELLFNDGLLVVARAGHRLTRKSDVHPEEICKAEWILPTKSSPSRLRLDEALKAAGLQIETNAIETNSVTLIRELLTLSDRLWIASNHQLYSDDLVRALSIVPVRLKASPLPIGIRTLVRPSQSAALKALLAHFRQIGAQLSDEYRFRMLNDQPAGHS